MKFKPEEHEFFLYAVNQWVRDGSNITDWWSNIFGEGVNLVDPDGCKENLVYWRDRLDYDTDERNLAGI